MQTKGHYHPITRFIDKSMQIFEELGFCVIEGPELESEWYNFDFLRVASDHPARDVQDTFWISGSKNKKLNVMRTHMTTVQGRAVKNVQPPCRFVMPGRVFRNENTDSTHESVFYQLDVVAIGESINLSQMIFCLHEFLKKLLNKAGLKIRLRPDYFPFVEPGMDIAIWWNNKWLEVFGAGMVHPEVIENMGLDPKKWQGFAFGGGIERLMMIKYDIKNIKSFLKNDMRFNKQF